jgi:hypothetical protein
MDYAPVYLAIRKYEHALWAGNGDYKYPSFADKSLNTHPAFLVHLSDNPYRVTTRP